MTNNYWDYPNTRLSIEDAMTIATTQIPGEIVKVELDNENGRLIYQVDIVTFQGSKYEMEIDATTGQITKLERD